MAFFKFRKSGDEQSATPAAAESVEGMRKRAKYRLIGAAVLVLIGVVGFPMLFDKQPRPISVDTPIEIPDKNKVKPLSIPAPAALESSAVRVAETPVITQPAETQPAHTTQVPAKTTVKPVPVAKPVVKPNEGAKAQALLDGKSAEVKPAVIEGRFIVQVGAFADAVRAREVRQKVEHAGLKTYTHVAQTKDGERIRVRVGPFSTRAEADKVAEKIKKLALPASILTL